jgi:transposase
MSKILNAAIAVVGIDIGKNAFHVVGQDERGAIVLHQKWSRGQLAARFANMPPCLVGMEACVGAHHLSRRLKALGHDARLMPAKYVRPYSKGQKNDFRDAEAIAEAVQRPTMKFVATKTADQLDLQAMHRVRERLVSQRTGIINQIRAFLLERGVAVRQGQRFLRAELPRILATPSDVLLPRMVRLIEDLAGDWRWLDERIEGLSDELETLARQDAGCERLMSVPGIGPIISSAMVAAIGTGDGFSKGRDFAARLGLVPKQMSTGDRTILGKISKRGNRYLRVLFVQAAWVVLIKPKSWERHEIEPANLPVPHFGSGAFAGIMVPLLPLPEESLTALPDPSSNFQCATNPLPPSPSPAANGPKNGHAMPKIRIPKATQWLVVHAVLGRGSFFDNIRISDDHGVEGSGIAGGRVGDSKAPIQS